MRKSFYLVIVFLLIALTSNGQYLVGGSLSFSTTGGKTEINSTETDSPSTTSFSINPQVGYMVSDKFLAGLGLTINLSNSKSNNASDSKSTSSYFAISPYANYYFLRANKFSLYCQARAGLGFGSDKVTSNTLPSSEQKITRISLNVYPGMAIDISHKLQLFTSLNVFGLGVSTSVEKNDDNKTVRTAAGFNANLNNILNIGSITLGAYIKF